jgi:benzoyl-CoA reductase subunit C
MFEYYRTFVRETWRGAPVPESIVRQCQELIQDFDYGYVREWKAADPSRRVIGYLPIYVPRPLLHGAGLLPVGVMGAGDAVEIIKGDAYFQSYICHLPRSFIELALDGKLAAFDGFLFPSICDVIRNLSGMWKLLFPGVYVRYLDLPQNFDPALGGAFYRGELDRLLGDLAEITGRRARNEDLLASIALYNRNREAIAELDRRRSAEPWRYPASEAYVVVRAGMIMEVAEHTATVERYLAAAAGADRPFRDGSRIVITGAFCEQPPLDLIRTLERPTTSCSAAAGTTSRCRSLATPATSSSTPTWRTAPTPAAATTRTPRSVGTSAGRWRRRAPTA